MATKVAKKASAERQLIFVHIPKTAGLSLYSALEKIYTKELSLRVSNEGDLKRFRELPTDQPLKEQFISGHFFYKDVKDRSQPDALYVSIMRDPITRILSNYNYITNWEKHPLYEKLIKQTFSEHVRENGNFLRGLCCRQLTGFNEAAPAIELIESRYALIGTTPNLPAFIAALNRLIGKKAPEERTNVSGGQGPKIDLSSELCEALLDITKEDRKLFDFLKAQPDGLFQRSHG